ncbi:hypothetical protein DRQ07_06590 [candidate division KSB1 bacterium]|nr:MAG: hypothetical protein DRQ07_06590 [candidate division KSB1 bacterium]
MTRKKQKRHSDRHDLAGEYRYGDSGQIFLLVIFIITWITDSFIFHFSCLNSVRFTFLFRLPISLVILFFSGYFAQSGLKIIFGKIRENPEIVNTGVFNIVRHPIYLGSILFYLGIIVLFPTWASIILFVAITAFYYFISLYEEKLLLQKFGDRYKKYQKEVPMLIPFFRKKINNRPDNC